MSKAKLTFSDIDLAVSVPVGARVIEISEKVGSGIIYGCREGDCGTCLMQVEEGANNLSSPSVVEHQILSNMAAGRNQRLACQAQVLGDCKVRPA